MRRRRSFWLQSEASEKGTSKKVVQQYLFLVEDRQKIFCCKLSLRFKRYSELMSVVMTSFFKLPTHDRTLEVYQVQLLARQCPGEKLILIDCLMQLSVILIQQ